MAENQKLTEPIPEEMVKSALEMLSMLIAPNRDSGADAIANNSSNVRDLDDALEFNLKAVENCEQYRNLLAMNFDAFVFPTSNDNTSCRWKFTCTCLQLMKFIHDIFTKSSDEKLTLLSVSQRKILETSLGFVISLGLLPYLLPNVGISLAAKCKTVAAIKPENINDFTKYRRLCSLVDAIFCLKDIDVFHDLIVSKHLEDLLAALFQLSFAPIKKPNGYDKHESAADLNAFDDKFEIDDMTFAIWRRLNENKQKYRQYLETVLQKTYKPLLIRKLMILSSKETPRWMKQNLTKILADMVLHNNGILAVTKAVIETDNEAPTQWSHCVTVAKLISNIFVSSAETNAVRLAKQISDVLKVEYSRTDDLTAVRVAALAVSLIFSHSSQTAEEHILNEILTPFVSPVPGVEVDEFIVQLFNLYAFTNEMFAIPARQMLPISRALYSIHCRVRDKDCRPATMVRELLVKIIRGVDESSLITVIDCLVFDEKHDVIRSLPEKIAYEVSPTGRITVAQTNTNLPLLDYAAVFLELVENSAENERIVRSLFVYLLKKFVSVGDSREDTTKKRCAIAKLLLDMSQKPTTLGCILKNPRDVIRFVNELLKTPSKDGEYDEIVRICLTFLTMILYDLRKKKHIDWEIFPSLLPSLEKYKNYSNVDVQILANEASNLIQTRGVIGNLANRESSIEQPSHSECDKYVEAACDELLPVRAHALVELISLIRKGDAETLAKKDKILCLFQENLKNEDSFLYLRAIEGVSCMATLKPDIVLPLLCEEFVTCADPATQLKVGEILVRTTKSLNDFIFSYKSLLLNTFLNGVRSGDSMIRASSLSNLAQVCLLLGRQVEDSLYEILHCVESVALYDKEVEPRRAALLFMTSLLAGLKSSMIEVLEERLLEIYRTLKRVHSTDEDYVVRLQAQLSLDALNENMKDILTLKPTLEKKIRVLDKF